MWYCERTPNKLLLDGKEKMHNGEAPAYRGRVLGPSAVLTRGSVPYIFYRRDITFKMLGFNDITRNLCLVYDFNRGRSSSIDPNNYYAYVDDTIRDSFFRNNAYSETNGIRNIAEPYIERIMSENNGGNSIRVINDAADFSFDTTVVGRHFYEGPTSYRGFTLYGRKAYDNFGRIDTDPFFTTLIIYELDVHIEDVYKKLTGLGIENRFTPLLSGAGIPQGISILNYFTYVHVNSNVIISDFSVTFYLLKHHTGYPSVSEQSTSRISKLPDVTKNLVFSGVYVPDRHGKAVFHAGIHAESAIDDEIPVNKFSDPTGNNTNIANIGVTPGAGMFKVLYDVNVKFKRSYLDDIKPTTGDVKGIGAYAELYSGLYLGPLVPEDNTVPIFSRFLTESYYDREQNPLLLSGAVNEDAYAFSFRSHDGVIYWSGVGNPQYMPVCQDRKDLDSPYIGSGPIGVNRGEYIDYTKIPNPATAQHLPTNAGTGVHALFSNAILYVKGRHDIGSQYPPSGCFIHSSGVEQSGLSDSLYAGKVMLYQGEMNFFSIISYLDRVQLNVPTGTINFPAETCRTRVIRFISTTTGGFADAGNPTEYKVSTTSDVLLTGFANRFPFISHFDFVMPEKNTDGSDFIPGLVDVFFFGAGFSGGPLFSYSKLGSEFIVEPACKGEDPSIMIYYFNRTGGIMQHRFSGKSMYSFQKFGKDGIAKEIKVTDNDVKNEYIFEELNYLKTATDIYTNRSFSYQNVHDSENKSGGFFMIGRKVKARYKDRFYDVIVKNDNANYPFGRRKNIIEMTLIFPNID